MIKVEDLKKRFGSKEVLNGITLNIPPQSIFGFIGVNGAGKSTFIKCILQFLKPTQGKIFLEGNLVSNYRMLKKILGYLPEVFHPPLDLKCQEFLNFCYVLIHNHACSEAKIRELLEKVGLGGSENIMIRKLSKGMRQRLGIAQAVIHVPKLLILDEPFSGLDPIGRYELKQFFKTLKTQGYTIFFSSHNLAEIQDLCSHAGLLSEGKIVRQGKLEEILDYYQTKNFEQAFLKAIGKEGTAK